MARTCRLDRSRQNLPSKRRRTAPPMPTFNLDSSDNESVATTGATAATAARLASQVSPTPETGENGNESRKLLELLSPEQIQQMLQMVNNSLEVVANQRAVLQCRHFLLLAFKIITMLHLLYLRRRIFLLCGSQWVATMNVLWRNTATASCWRGYFKKRLFLKATSKARRKSWKW